MGVKTFTPKSIRSGPLSLQSVDRAVRQAYADLDSSLTPRYTLTDTTASIGELVVVDTSLGNVVISLRDYESDMNGKRLAVINMGGSGTCTVKSARKLINKSLSSVEIEDDVMATFYLYSKGNWAVGNPKSYGPAAYGPTWSWNGTDVSELGSASAGAGLSYGSTSFVTSYGRPAIRLSASGVGLSPVPPNTYAVIPITGHTPTTANYRVVMEWIKKTGPASGAAAAAGLGVAARWASSTVAGDGYVMLHISSTAQLEILAGGTTTVLNNTLVHYQTSQVGSAGIDGWVSDMGVSGSSVLTVKAPRFGVHVDSSGTYASAGNAGIVLYGPGGGGNSWVFDIYRLEIWED